MKTWFITGAAAGLGMAIATAALERGDRVAVAARNPEKARPLLDRFPDRTLPIVLDVTEATKIGAAVAKAEQWAGGIDVLVNNAGRGMHGAIEEASDEEVREIFDLNVFSLVNVTRAVLPIMRRQRSGHILNVGSVAGLTADAGTGFYSATKFALEGISEALNAEVSPLGIKVTVLEPGPFRTDFNGRSLQFAARHIEDYEATAGKRMAALRAGSGKQSGDPAKAAELVCDIVALEKPPLHLCVGAAAIERARAKIDRLLADIGDWEERSIATAFS